MYYDEISLQCSMYYVLRKNNLIISICSSILFYKISERNITSKRIDIKYSLLFIYSWSEHSRRFSTILKRGKKSVWSNVLKHVKVRTFWKCIRYTIHWDKTQILKKFWQNKQCKKCPPFSFASSNSSQFDF